MAPFPLPLTELLGHYGSYVVYFFVGLAFGYVLEIAGFANSKKLAGQFYFTDMTVLKVMFTGIIVAMVLIFSASAVGLLDYNLVWVNPTYLWPGIVGGLIMGFGFIIGGFCPGTSLVAAATGKIDGIFFVGGVFFGIFLFGETVSRIRRILELLLHGTLYAAGIPQSAHRCRRPAGRVHGPVHVLGLRAAGEHFRRQRSGGSPQMAIRRRAGHRRRGCVCPRARPTHHGRSLGGIAAEKNVVLNERSVQIHPGELLDKIYDPKSK
jgi:uncharacterized membrane protein YedE/YeeE